MPRPTPEQTVIAARYAKAAYDDSDDFLTVVPPNATVTFFTGGSTQVYTVTHRNTLTIAFRGTEPSQVKDWLRDANAEYHNLKGMPGSVHEGFHRALQEVWSNKFVFNRQHYELRVHGNKSWLWHPMWQDDVTDAKIGEYSLRSLDGEVQCFCSLPDGNKTWVPLMHNGTPLLAKQYPEGQMFFDMNNFGLEYQQGLFEHVTEFLSANPERKLELTGHSLGGALSQLFALVFINDSRIISGIPNEDSANKISKIITFGSPMVFSPDMSQVCDELFGDNLHRFNNENDIVPDYPFFGTAIVNIAPYYPIRLLATTVTALSNFLAITGGSFTYRHIGDTNYISYAGNVVINPSWSTEEWDKFKGALHGKLLFEKVLEHSMDKYLTHLEVAYARTQSVAVSPANIYGGPRVENVGHIGTAAASDIRPTG